MDDESTIAGLVLRARGGDQSAWDVLVERFAPLLWSVCRRYRLSDSDAADVGQSVWLRLLEHLDDVREPAALPGWLATTTARQCLGVLRAEGNRQRRETTVADELLVQADAPSPDEPVLRAERNDAVRAAFAQLGERCRSLLGLLAQDPPLSYAEISERLEIPVGGLGPTRARCLDKLRRQQPLAAFLDRGAAETRGHR